MSQEYIDSVSFTPTMDGQALERSVAQDFGYITLDGTQFYLDGPIDDDLVNIYSRKSNQGDPRPDDHPTFTTFIQHDWSGGALIYNRNAASDQNRYYWATGLSLDHPSAMGLSAAAEIFPPQADGPCWVLGDMNDQMIVSFGQTVYQFNPVSKVFTLIGDLQGVPIDEGKVFRSVADPHPVMFIPEGNHWDVITTDPVYTISNGTGGAQDFEVWDDKIFKLDMDGQVQWATSFGGAWTTVARISDGSKVTGMVSYMDNSKNPALFVVTNQQLWVLDFGAQLLHKTDLDFPKHPYQGLASASHRGDLFVTVGVGIHRYDGNTISGWGLDGGDGMPQEFRGYITSLASGYNSLFAMIRGVPQGSDITEEETFDLGLVDPFNVPLGDSKNVLMFHSGFGWHEKYTFTGSRPTNVYVSDAASTYYVYFGDFSGKMYRIPLPIMYYNARYDVAPFPLNTFGEYRQGWYNWGWEGQDTIAKQQEIMVKGMIPGMTVEVAMKFDREENPWLVVANIDSDMANEQGEYRFKLGVDHLEPTIDRGRKGKYKGIRHQMFDVRVRIRNNSGDVYKTPYITWLSTVARRWLRPQRTWRVPVNLNKVTRGTTPEDMNEELFLIGTKQEAVVFQHQDRAYMVELVGMRGRSNTGPKKQYSKSLSLVEANDLGPNGEE